MCCTNNFFIKKIAEQFRDDYMTPKYKVEVALDTFLSIFFDSVINQYLYNNRELNGKVILISKEFPIKKVGNNQSRNIDFLYANKKVLYIVELKTTSKSYDEDQLKEYIKFAIKVEQEGNATFLLRDYHKIMDETQQTAKYKWQFDNKVKSGIMQVNKLQNIDEVKILYVIPTLLLRKLLYKDSRVRCITLDELSRMVLSEQFADKDTREGWDEFKTILSDINKMDIAL